MLGNVTIQYDFLIFTNTCGEDLLLEKFSLIKAEMYHTDIHHKHPYSKHQAKT